MPKFVLVYHGGSRPESKEAGAAHMANWRAWSKGLGDAVVDPGMPVGPSKTVSANGVVDGAPDPISGITVLQAETMEAALVMAKACPHLNLGGTIEIAEAMQMEM